MKKGRMNPRAICASRIQTDNPSRPPFEKGGEDTPPNREFLSGAYPPPNPKLPPF